MKITVIDGKNLTAEHVADWTRLQKSDSNLASPYFCPEFTTAVAAVRNDVRIGLIEEVAETVGFFPFHRGKFQVGNPVGGLMSDYHGVVLRSGFQLDAADLIRGCGLVTWDFNHLPASQKMFQKFFLKTAESPQMDLSGGYEAYRQTRREAGSEQVRRVDALERKFEREIGPLRFNAQVSDIAVLRTLLTWKSAQYLQSGGTDIFAFEWTRKLLERIHASRGENFSGVLSALYADNEMAAVHFGMRSRTVWHYWFPAYNMKFARYSPGLILLLKMAAAAENLGVCTIDLGKGGALYKQRLANGAIALTEGSVELPSLVGSARRCWRRARNLIRRTPLFTPARAASRFFRRQGARSSLD